MKNISKYWIVVILCATIGAIFLIESQDPKVEEVRESPHGRAEWRSMMRSGDMAPEKVLAARQVMRNLYQRARLQRDGGLNKWEFKGPHAVGGRVRAFATHPSDPNILYTGGVSGGIFKSTDAGVSWTALDDFLPSLSITSIIIKPTNPDVLYASTGEGITAGGFYTGSSPGAGIFKSTDAGDTWNLLNALDPNNLEGFYWVNDLAFNPEDPSIFYAVAQGTNGPNPTFGCAKLYRFSQNGNSVTELPIPCASTAYSVYINPSDSAHIMVGHAGGMYISWDGGHVNWDSNLDVTGFATLPGRVEFGMSASDPDVVYALCGGSVTGTLLRSDDKGMNWMTQQAGLTIFNGQGTYNNVIWVDPTASNHLIIGGIDVWRSLNSGVTLTQLSDWTQNSAGISAHADQHVIVPAIDYDAATNPRIYFGNDGGIAKTDNWKTATQTTGWTLLNQGLDITQFYASDIDGNNPNQIIAGGQDNGTWLTEDSGASWTKVDGGDGGYCAFDKQSTNLVYVSIQFGDFRIKIPPLNAFVSYWDLATVEFNQPFIAPMKIYPNDGTRILVAGQKLWQVTSTPSAVHQEVTPPGASNGELITAIDITADSSMLAIGYTDGKIFINQNGTAGVWQDKSLSVTGTVTSIAIHPTNTDRIMVSVGGYRDDNIWYTNNGGTTWIERSDGMPAIQVNTLVWHPDVNTWVYAGTDMGVMSSENNGMAWNVTPTNKSNDGPAMVEVSQLQFSRNNTFGDHVLIATTYGRGIWSTKFVVRDQVYIDEDCTTCGLGLEAIPFQTVEEAEERQASGQTWHFDGGSYPVNGKLVIDKRIGKIVTDNNEIVRIGN